MSKNSQLFRYTCGVVSFLLIFTVAMLIVSAAQMLATENLPVTNAMPEKEADQALSASASSPLPPPPDPYTGKITSFGAQIPSPTDMDPALPQYDSLTVSERCQNGSPIPCTQVPYYYGNKVVYLTFDDGPDITNTPKVLDILDEFHVKATFFVVGTQVSQHPELLQRIFDAGHAIGNHSYNHNYKQLYASVDSYFEQLHQNEELIRSIIHVRPCISRAPGGPVGSFTKAYWDQLKDQGYRDICWNISSGDASGLQAAQILPNITHQLENDALQSHAIILMHDGTGHEETVKALPDLICSLQQQGYEFRVVNLFTPPAW